MSFPSSVMSDIIFFSYSTRNSFFQGEIGFNQRYNQSFQTSHTTLKSGQELLPPSLDRNRDLTQNINSVEENFDAWFQLGKLRKYTS